MKKTLGDMLYETIVEGNVSQSDLCKGLCSTSALSRYLNGERKIDRLLLTVLMQRLGKSPDKFTTILTDDEYQYFFWRQQVSHAQMKKDWKQVRLLLECEEAREWNCNLVIQEQFYLLMQGIVQEKLFGNRAKSVQLLEQAILKTVPGFLNGLDSHSLLGVQEVSAILLWQKLQPDEEISMEILHYLADYVFSHYQDEQEVVKLYPKVAAQYLQLLYAKEQFFECLAVSEKAIRMMVSSGYASSMESILAVNVASAEKLGLSEQVKKRKVQLAAWKELMEEINPSADCSDDELYMLDVWQEAELADEIISLARQERGFTQEQLSEEICTPETLSRIETGSRAPSRKNYQALTRKLSLREDYYYSDIETDDFSVLEQKWKLDFWIMNKRWEEAEKELQKLKSRLDLSVVINWQYVEKEEYIIDNCLGRKMKEERFSRLMDILGYTIKELPKGKEVSEWSNSFWCHPFSHCEISIMTEMAGALVAENEIEQAITLLEKVMAFYRRSRILPEFHYRTVTLIVARLSVYYGWTQNKEKQLEYSEEGIRLLSACGSRKMLSLFVNNKADALEHLGNKNASLKNYKLAFYCAELLQHGSADISKRSYEKLSEEPIEWY